MRQSIEINENDSVNGTWGHHIPKTDIVEGEDGRRCRLPRVRGGRKGVRDRLRELLLSESDESDYETHN